MSDSQIISDGIELAESIRPLLAGKKPAVIDSALAQLFAMVLAVQHPDVRERMLSKHMLLIGWMVPMMDREIFSRQRRPKDWPPAIALDAREPAHRRR